ncbi:hypothetical protein [Streptomyces sp. NPDC003023]|uniref:hypothetical protein n=1 Tax=Streptomyces sp. NPDC003023 TaxID=3364675 RepID=UPI00367C001A
MEEPGAIGPGLFLCALLRYGPCRLGDSAAATHETRQHTEADATGDHRRGTDDQERGLGGAGLRQLTAVAFARTGVAGPGELFLALALLDGLRAGVVGVGVVTVTAVAATGVAVAARVAVATVSATIGTTVSATIGTTVSTTIGTAVSATIGTTIGTAVSTAVSTTVSATIGTAVSATIGTAVSTAVSATIGTTIGTAVSTTVSATIGTAVSTTIGTTVSATIGTAVSTTIGTAVSTAVRTATQRRVDDAVVVTVAITEDADIHLGLDAADLRRAGQVEGLCGPCGGQRRTRGDHGTGGYTRDANPRLLGHLAATPSSYLVVGAASGAAGSGADVPRPRSHTPQKYACRAPPFPVSAEASRSLADAMPEMLPVA